MNTTGTETLAKLAVRINAAHEAGEKALGKGLQHFRKAGDDLIEAKKLVDGHNWHQWLRANVVVKIRRAQQYAEFASELCAVTARTGQELSLDETVQLWARISGNAEKAAHVSNNSGENEWYTPPEYLDAAREVLGTIDLDPASSDKAQETVGAASYFTREDDGLAQPWSGNVWLNPPYAPELIGKFVDKLCEHVESGDVTASILLVNNATETAWFQKALGMAAAACFPEGRVKFLDPDGNPGAPLQGQSVLYFGKKPALFIEQFGGFGACARTV